MSAGPHRAIYLTCPAKSRTGGPEAMHQLGRALLDLGHDVHIVYTMEESDLRSGDGGLDAPEIDSPMPEPYAAYRVPRAIRIPDEAGIAVVFPEVWPALAARLTAATPYLWWLSIDFGLRHVETLGGFEALRATRCVHLCQSYYALGYLMERNITGWPLFDHTSPDKLEAASLAPGHREARILYPSRGKWFTSWLQRWAPDLEWREIAGLTPDQVRDLFLTSRLYVDFGNHPGKDRMPREAAILGCCVITGQRGAAANALDVPIPARYKFRDSRFMVPRIVRAVRGVLAEHEDRVGDFARYRAAIRGERREFLVQALRVFGGRLDLPDAITD